MKIRQLFTKKLIYPLVLVLLLAAAVLSPRLARLDVETATVSRGTVRDYVFEEETRTRLDVLRTVSAPIGGTMKRIEATVGDVLEAGAVLTTIEDDEIKHAIAAARSRIREIEARIEGLPTQVPKEPELQAAAAAVMAAVQMHKAVQAETLMAEEDLEFRRREYERARESYQKDAISGQDYDRARHEYALARQTVEFEQRRLQIVEIITRIAEFYQQTMHKSLGDIDHLETAYAAQIDQIGAELDTLSYQAEKTSVTVPLRGVVTRKYIDSEAVVSAGTPLVEIGDLATVEVKSDVLSADIARVKPGQKVILEGGILGDESMAATVNRIEPHGFTKVSALGIEQQRFRVIIDIDAAEHKLPPGADLDARIIVDEKDDVLYIPPGAMFTTPQGPAVFTVAKGRARLRHIAVGLYGDQRLEITDGLDEGDTVILRPPQDLEPGDRVALRNNGP